jgi:hypothetical protein
VKPESSLLKQRSVDPCPVKGCALSGGRSWWAHFTLTRMNTGPIIQTNQFEDLMGILGLVVFCGGSG